MGKSSPAPPPAPDYTGAANATAANNLEAARAAAAANRINQYTPYGSLTYKKTGSDPDGGWSQYVSLAPEQQKLLDIQNQVSLGLGDLSQKGLGFVNDALANPLTIDDLPSSMVNAGQTGQEALMARFQPMIEQSRQALTSQLANQGIQPGTEAFDNAFRVQNQSENDLRMQAALNGINVGQNAQNQQLSLKSALQNNPINILNAVRTGSQVTNPQFGGYAQQGQTSGADMMGAAKEQNQYNLGLYNSQVAETNAGNAATTGLVGMAAMAAAIF